MNNKQEIWEVRFEREIGKTEKDKKKNLRRIGTNEKNIRIRKNNFESIRKCKRRKRIKFSLYERIKNNSS